MDLLLYNQLLEDLDLTSEDTLKNRLRLLDVIQKARETLTTNDEVLIQAELNDQEIDEIWTI